tara:strand:+ start:8541 stop:9527 length:987 start_codon:yes stop_codon:yes gene_type:complete
MIYKSYQIEKNTEFLKEKIILFYGENLGLKNDLKKKIRLTNKNSHIYNYNQDEIITNKNNFEETFLNISLFDEKKIYFIEFTNDKILNLIQDLENKINNQKIYLFADTLEKKSKLRNYFEKSENLAVIACYNDNEISIKKIILDKLNGYEGLTSENINMLITNSNLNRVKLNNELNKIETYFINKKISKSELNILLNLNENEDFNELKDAALSGNEKATNKLLSETIIDNEKSIFYISLFNQRLTKIREILSDSGKSIESSIESVKPPIFWKDKPAIKKQAAKWNKKKIKTTLQNTYNLEIRLKSSSNIDKTILIKKFIIDICVCANS